MIHLITQDTLIISEMPLLLKIFLLHNLNLNIVYFLSLSSFKCFIILNDDIHIF